MSLVPKLGLEIRIRTCLKFWYMSSNL